MGRGIDAVARGAGGHTGMLIGLEDPRAAGLIAKARLQFKGGSTETVAGSRGYVSYFEDPVTRVLLALGVASVRPRRTKRSAPHEFGEDVAHRHLWIDYVWSSGGGNGTRVLQELEGALRGHLAEAERPNIYVLHGVGSWGFYHKRGYVPVWTPDHPDDPCYYGEVEENGGLWCAKPLGEAGLVGEKTCMPSIHALAERKLRRVYHLLFTDPAPPMGDMIRFIENMEDEDDGWLVPMVERLRDADQREGVAWSMGL